MTNSQNFLRTGSSYTENGFTVSQFGPQAPDTLAAFGTQASDYTGSAALFNTNTVGAVQLTKVGGDAFNLSSIDLSTFGKVTPSTVAFIGTRADSTTVNQSFTTDAIGSTIETFNFNNFTNLVSVNWTQNFTNLHQFDNINVSAVNATAVPEPFTILGALFGASYGVSLKRKLAKEQADKGSID